MIKIVDRNGARAMTAQRVRSLSHAEDEVAPSLADVRERGDGPVQQHLDIGQLATLPFVFPGVHVGD